MKDRRKKGFHEGRKLWARGIKGKRERESLVSERLAGTCYLKKYL